MEVEESDSTHASTQAEHVVALAGSRLVTWFRRLLLESGFEQDSPTVLYMINAAAEQLVQNPIQHVRTKHFDVKFRYNCEWYEKSEIDVQHASTNDQHADMFTRRR